MVIGATHNGYIAPKGWKPKNPDENYIITYLDIELADGIGMDKFEDVVAACAAESSTGTWTDVYSGRDSGVRMAEKLRAVAFDLEPETKTFKIAYKKELFELDNMSGILAGVVGNIDGMKMLKAFRCLDIRFPKDIIQSFQGPQFGIDGMRELLHVEEGPLLCTVPKPKVGRTAKEQAKLAEILFSAANAQYHGIKDDENLTSLRFNTFDDRCELIHRVLREVERKTGQRKFYLCNVTHSNLDVMIQRADKIKAQGGRWMMMDIVTTGFSAIQTMRMHNPGLAIHAHRAMHSLFDRESGPGVYDKGEIKDFSMSMIVTAKIMRMLGVDSLHGGAPNTKMENYGEPKLIRDALQLDITPASSMTLGQNWYGMKPVWHVASGGLHPGTIPEVLHQLGEDIIIQTGGGVLGHPWGIEAGVEAVIQAKDVVLGRGNMEQWIVEHPDTALAKAAHHWGFGPKII
ncbi:MAG: Ribulose bisphosphate carboxylase, type III [candidate division WS6 bacterium GW2011_GWC2_36_7]|uniref:Ribulose bisphosphate carboxylase, type III n=2 Tax=Candidatus Dojkabacteria TaxID=74243 RepID=A0A0G0I4W1_9BACT|nr:MAG: Ribulose bisphosphate carboxylase, type III [candidate division WS6 bacterium GW2011_WS6_36_26]KKQ11116.1 MAG: Ribulose bisphosphate carboxylase, type III [candidate division WS6 bacterium GW2011_GWC2_36_7]HAM37390.1 ribulose-bisphosphate carboxylase large subunit [Patescibacteria group bacterium]HAM96418.1 ribulose-bisphosphate carboxylase large subunit [Patescibacteria group bacterium]